MPEEKDYISKVHAALKDNLDGFNKDEATFRKEMESPEYAKKVYVALKDNLDGFDRSESDFYSQIGVKKKDAAAPVSKEQSSNGSTNDVQPIADGTEGNDIPLGYKTLDEVIAVQPKKEPARGIILPNENKIKSISDFNKKYNTEYTEESFREKLKPKSTIPEKVLSNKDIDNSHILEKYNIVPYATQADHEERVNDLYQKFNHLNIDSPESIDHYIKQNFPKSPLTGEMIKNAADKEGVDPKAILAIIQQDSQLGTKGLGSPQDKGKYISVNYNPGNLTAKADGTMKIFNSWDEGVDGVAKWLKKHEIKPYENIESPNVNKISSKLPGDDLNKVKSDATSVDTMPLPIVSKGNRLKEVKTVADFNEKYDTDHTPQEMLSGAQAWRHPKDHPKAVEEEKDANLVKESMESTAAGLDATYAMVLRMPGMLYNTFAIPQNLIADTTGAKIGIKPTGTDPLSKYADVYAENAKEVLAEQQQKYDKSLFDEFNEGDKGKAIHQLSNAIIQMLPPMMAMAGAGMAGASPIAVETGGALGFGSQKYDEIQSLNLPESTKMANALGTGMLMSMFNKWSLDKMTIPVAKALTEKGEEVAAQVAKKTFEETYKSVFNKLVPVTKPLESGIAFAATGFFTNVLDKVTGVAPDKDLSEGLVDMFIEGTALGLGTHAGTRIYNRERRDKVEQLHNETEQVKKDADNPEVNPEVKDALLQTYQDKTEQLNKELQIDGEHSLKYTPKEKAFVDDLSEQVEQNKKVIDDPAVSIETKNIKTDENDKLNGEIDKLNKTVEKRSIPKIEDNASNGEPKDESKNKKTSGEKTEVLKKEAQAGDSVNTPAVGQFKTKTILPDKLKTETVKPSDPILVKDIPIFDLYIDPEVKKEVQKRLKSGIKSTRGNDPISVLYHSDGTMEVKDGLHRVLSKKEGESIDALVFNVEQDYETFKPPKSVDTKSQIDEFRVQLKNAKTKDRKRSIQAKINMIEKLDKLQSRENRRTKIKKSVKFEPVTESDFIEQVSYGLSEKSIVNNKIFKEKGDGVVNAKGQKVYPDIPRSSYMSGRVLKEGGRDASDIANDLINEGGIFEHADPKELEQKIIDHALEYPAGVTQYLGRQKHFSEQEARHFEENSKFAEEQMPEDFTDDEALSYDALVSKIQDLTDEDYEKIKQQHTDAVVAEDDFLNNIYDETRNEENGISDKTAIPKESDRKSREKSVSKGEFEKDLDQRIESKRTELKSAKKELAEKTVEFSKRAVGDIFGKPKSKGDILDTGEVSEDVAKKALKPYEDKVKTIQDEFNSLDSNKSREQAVGMDKSQLKIENKAVDTAKLKSAFKMSQSEFVGKKIGTAEEYQKLRGNSLDAPTIFESGEKEYATLDAGKKVKGKRIQVEPIEGGTPKKLNEIVLDLSEGVKKDILFSKKPSSRRSLGSYNPTNAATKIKFREDLDVTAHEIGHALDDRYGLLSKIPEAELPTIEKELKKFAPHGSNPPAGHSNPKLYKMGEGVAEWIRAHVVNPTEAEKSAPKFTQWYKDHVPVDIQKGIEIFSNDIRTYAGATNIEKMKSAIDFDASKKKGSLLDFLKPSTSNENGFKLTFFDRMKSRIVNPMRATDVAFKFAMGEKGITDVLPENDPRVIGKLFLGINDKMDNMLEHGLVDAKNKRIIDPVTEKPMTIDWLMEPFDSSSEATLKSESEDMIASMVAERVAEKYQQFQLENIQAEAEGKALPHPNIERLVNAGAGIYKNLDVINGVIKDMASMKEENPDKYARIQEGARRYRAYADQMMRYQVEKGRMSIEEYQDIKDNNAYYVGLGRIMEAGPNEEIISPFHGSGNIGSVTTFDAFKGSDRMIQNPYEFLLEATYKSMKEADRNDVMRSFVDILKSDRDMYEGEPNKLATVGREASEKDPNTITVFDQGQKKVWQFDDDIYASLKNLQDLTYNLPSIVTLLPSILRASVTNFPVFALRNRVRDFQSRLILSKSGTKFEDIFNKPADIKDRYQLFGAGQAGYYLTNEGFYYKKLQKSIEDLAGTNTIVAHPMEMAERVWDSYRNLLASSERATRLEEYNAAYRKAKGAGMDDYNANLHAAYQSRDLMDFSVMGTWMRYINQIVPFSNAAVQGLRKMYNTAHDNPAGFGTRMVLYSIIPSLLTRMAASMFGDDDKWYKKLPAYQRDLFFNFKIGDNKILAIPKPYELGMAGSFSDRLVDRMLGDKNAFDGHAGTIARSFFPFDEGTLAGPAGAAVEVAANYDFFRHKHIVPPDEEKEMIELRNTEYASRMGKLIQREIGVDARNVDFVIKRLTSYYGDLALRLSNIGAEGKQDQFGLQSTGFEKGDAAMNSKDATWIIDKYEESGIENLPFNIKKDIPMFSDYVILKSMNKTYYQAKSDHDKQQVANTIRDYAERARKNWEGGQFETVKKAMLNLKEVKAKK